MKYIFPKDPILGGNFQPAHDEIEERLRKEIAAETQKNSRASTEKYDDLLAGYNVDAQLFPRLKMELTDQYHERTPSGNALPTLTSTNTTASAIGGQRPPSLGQAQAPHITAQGQGQGQVQPTGTGTAANNPSNPNPNSADPTAGSGASGGGSGAGSGAKYYTLVL